MCYELFDFKNTIIFKTIIYRVTGLPQICFDCTALYTAYTVYTVKLFSPNALEYLGPVRKN